MRSILQHPYLSAFDAERSVVGAAFGLIQQVVVDVWSPEWQIHEPWFYQLQAPQYRRDLRVRAEVEGRVRALVVLLARLCDRRVDRIGRGMRQGHIAARDDAVGQAVEDVAGLGVIRDEVQNRHRDDANGAREVQKVANFRFGEDLLRTTRVCLDGDGVVRIPQNRLTVGDDDRIRCRRTRPERTG